MVNDSTETTVVLKQHFCKSFKATNKFHRNNSCIETIYNQEISVDICKIPPKQQLYWNLLIFNSSKFLILIPPKQQLYWNYWGFIVVYSNVSIPPKQQLYWNKSKRHSLVWNRTFHRNNSCIETLTCNCVFTKRVKFHRNNSCIETSSFKLVKRKIKNSTETTVVLKLN